jgi:hypothetical protein
MGTQRPNTVVLNLETVLGGVERLRHHGEHRQDLRQHHAVLRARLRGVFSRILDSAFLPLCPLTLSLSAAHISQKSSASGWTYRGGASNDRVPTAEEDLELLKVARAELHFHAALDRQLPADH